MFGSQNENSDDTETVIDKEDNVFVMSNRKTKYPTLQLDLRLIKDLVVIIVSATAGGIIFSCLGQPVIVGYLLAGSLIGPGGLNLINEMVQVETFAQFGVVFLLFALGLEFSLPKLKVVGPVAVLGGVLQIALFMFLCGLTAALCGAKLSEGVFVGTFLSMSSTAVVSKFLVEKGSTNALHGQVTIGTLILQTFVSSSLNQSLIINKYGATNTVYFVLSNGLCNSRVNCLEARLMERLCSWPAVCSHSSSGWFKWHIWRNDVNGETTNELYQLAAVAFCLLLAWCSDYLGLSLELGSFLAGVMISTTDFAHHTLEQVEAIRNLFAALFLASIGMLIHFKFLWNHVDILLAAVILVIIVKSIVITAVIKSFGYSIRTAFIGKMYLLLLGTTALSLVTTPLIFKLIPVVTQLGILMRWFPSESGVQNEVCFLSSLLMVHL
ncbi:unnamed protein product [Triticum turgidum subsp. durum]|uniref:Cation/H+ exchanger transmembrane domain-containing protein n=1 Tax=Triticum turgidum subsp. durum TaxID=4567 RepID=A0A9R0WUP2_TRITD|nr:unnamed protein product [Triticum turgidum subsp. durum]